MNLTERIELSFKHWNRPIILTKSSTLSEDELLEVRHFEDLTNSNLTIADLEDNFSVMYWFTPEAYCYFLPGILIAGLKAHRDDLLIYDSIVNLLDRSPEPDYWDEFFIDRWQLLTNDEIEIIQEWLLWLTSQNSPYDDISLGRCFDTLELLVKQKI
ncbi:MAG: hypothetical protein ACI8WB_002851 [Phenylobacterium sp.]|jgi:hypothetical protein